MLLSIADFNEGQVAAVDNLQKFLDPADPRAFYGLFGFAGTGKSTVLSYLGHTQAAHDSNIVMCAPTHKAVSVLKWMRDDRSALRRFETIHKMLHIKGVIDEKTGETVFDTHTNFTTMPLWLEAYNVLIVDECSMLDKEKVELIEYLTTVMPLKVVYVGDPYQLPPVTEENLNKGRSFSFNCESRIILKEVERSHGPVAAAAHAARKAIGKKERLVLPTTEGTQRITSEKELLRQYMEVHATGQILTFTNADVKKWNDRVRTQIHGAGVPYFHPGDRLVAAKSNGAVSSSEEFLVTSAVAVNHMGVECWKLYFEDKLFHLYACEPGTQDQARIIEETRRKKQWLKDKKGGHGSRRSYERWQEFQNAFHDLRHGYAQTIHKSQGSTYEQVFVEEGELYERMWRPHELKFRGKLLYVAYSRAATRLVVL
jgi:ATP-dependent exoDNAse (exonuclease V) alpha subunit